MDEDQLATAEEQLEEEFDQPAIKRVAAVPGHYRVVYMVGQIENLRGWYAQFELEEVEAPVDNGDGFDAVVLKAPEHRVVQDNLECLTIVQSVEKLPSRTILTFELVEHDKSVGEMRTGFEKILADCCDYHCAIKVSKDGQPVPDDYVPQDGDSLLFDTTEIKNEAENE